MKLKFSIFLIGLISFSSLFAQDIKADLQKIKENHTVNEFEANINYKFFKDNVLTEELNATHVFQRGNYYFKIGDIEIVNNKNCQLIVNHAFKAISVMPSGKENDFKRMTNIPLDTALKEVASYSFKSISASESIYFVSLKKGDYRKIELHFNPKTFLITKLKLFVSEAFALQDPDMAGGVLVIEYNGYKTKLTPASKLLLDEKKFISIKNDKAALVLNYNNYELTDYLDIKP